MEALLPFLPWVIGGIIVMLVALGLISVGITNANQADPLAERLADYIEGDQVTANLEEIEMSVPFMQRVMLPIMQQVARITTRFAPQQALAETQKLIDIAGNPSGLTPPVFWAMRFAAMIAMGALLPVLFSSRGTLWVIGGLIGGAGLGFMMPQLWLKSKTTRRQNEIQKSLPDALDLMTICVEAGLGFDQAMSKVYEKWDNELGLAFGRVIQEIALGRTRRDALKRMDETTGLSDLTTFTSAIIQADQLGVSIARVLKIQSEQMRIKRRQRAQEKAQQAPIKMMIPMVLLIFPNIWLVLMGPAGVQVCKTFMPGLCVY